MGMSYNEFKCYTPRHFRIYVEAYNKNMVRDIDLANMRAGKICATVVNLVSRRKYKPEDFFKKLSTRKTAQTGAQMAEIFKTITIAMGGTVNG